MKQNRIDYSRRRKLGIISAIVAILAIIVSLVIGYGKLRTIYLERCVVVDMERQVTITSGKMVKEDVIAEEFGIRKGANLALIDYAEKRESVLAKIPNLRMIKVTRKLPDRVIIETEERSPVAKINLKGHKDVSGLVVDSEGVVFLCQRGTASLPTIYQGGVKLSSAGNRLENMMLAALQLVEMCREPGFLELGILDVDTSKLDYLTATLGNYSRAKIAWEGMGDNRGDKSKKSLSRQLTMLVKAYRSKLGENTVMWNATDTSEPGYIYADSKGN